MDSRVQFSNWSLLVIFDDHHFGPLRLLRQFVIVARQLEKLVAERLRLSLLCHSPQLCGLVPVVNGGASLAWHRLKSSESWGSVKAAFGSVAPLGMVQNEKVPFSSCAMETSAPLRRGFSLPLVRARQAAGSVAPKSILPLASDNAANAKRLRGRKL